MSHSHRVATALASALAAGAIALTIAPTPARADAERVASWNYERVWPAAVRFLRVDEGYKIEEKDSEAGYVIFWVDDDGKTFRGALELIKIVVDRRPSVRLVLEIEDRPNYMEEGALRRMMAKLRKELGPPPPPPPPEKKPEDTGKAK